MIKNRMIFFIALIFSLFCFVYINALAGIFLLLLCVFMPLCSYFFMLYAQKGMRIVLTLPPSAEEGKSTPLICRMEKNNGFMIAQIVLKISLKNKLCEEKYISELCLKRMRGKKDESKLIFYGGTIGKIKITVHKAYCLDALGLFRKKIKNIGADSLMVLPRLWDVEFFNMPKVEITDEGQVYSQHKPGRDNTEIFAMHEYVPGDDIRRIHWKLSSKIDQLMVRDFSLPLNYSLFILLELSKKTASPAQFPAAVKLALSVSYALCRQQMGHSIGWYDNETSSLIIKEIKDDDDIADAVSALVCTQGYENAFALQNAAEGNYLPNNAFVYYIANGEDDEWLAAFKSRYNVQLLIPPQEEVVENGGASLIYTV